MNKKERRLAYATAFQNAAESITVVDDLEVGHLLDHSALLLGPCTCACGSQRARLCIAI